MPKAFVFFFAFFSLLNSSSVQAQHPDIGLGDLRNEVGAANVDGTGVRLLHVEAPDANGNHSPDTASSQFSNKSFSGSTGGGASAHGTNLSLIHISEPTRPY